MGRVIRRDWTRRGALGAVLGAAALGLGGCGFEPMYGRRNRPVIARLTAIKIDRIPDRVGQVLRNALLSRMSPAGEPARPLYRLQVTVSQSSSALAIQPDDSITRFNLRLTARFRLYEITSGRLLYKDSTTAVGSYNAVQSDFANLSAERDTATRAAEEASQEITTLLALYFSRREEAGG